MTIIIIISSLAENVENVLFIQSKHPRNVPHLETLKKLNAKGWGKTSQTEMLLLSRAHSHIAAHKTSTV